MSDKETEITIIPTRLHSQLTDVSTPHVLADLEAAVCSETEALAIARGALDYPKSLKPALVRWVVPGWYIEAVANQLVGAGSIYYTPIFVGETTTYDRIGIDVGIGAAGQADLRIYNWENGLPTTQVLSAGTVDTTVAGAKEIVINQELTRGYYFLAVRCDAAPSLQSADTVRAVAPPVAGQTNIASSTLVEMLIMSVLAALADPAPAPNSIQGGQFCFVALREA